MSSTWPTGRAAIAGVAETKYEFRSTKTIQELLFEAAAGAIEDAGLTPADIDGVAIEGSMVSHYLPPEDLLASLGVGEWSYLSMGGMVGAGIVGSLGDAACAIASGTASAVLCYFGTDFGSSPAGPYGFHGVDPYKQGLEMPFGFYGQPTYFGAVATRYMHEYGLEEEQLGALAVATRRWATMHEGALMRDELTMAEYLASRPIASPLKVRDCCLVNDGAAAAVVVSAERARDLPHRPVHIAGVSYAHGAHSSHSALTQADPYLSTMADVSGPTALVRAGMSVGDVDVFEIYDCFTITCILQLEGIGLCERGEGAAFVADGRTGPGGSVPVNTHGGLLSHSYVLGINHVVEATRQLRGECGLRQVPDAEVALVAGLGGPDHATAVLTR